MKGRTFDQVKNRKQEAYSYREGLKRVAEFIQNSELSVRKRDILLNDKLPNERWFI